MKDAGKDFRSYLGLSLTVIAIALFLFLDKTPLVIPNSTAILTLFVVFSAFTGGIRVGLIAAGASWLYAMIHFSAWSFFHFLRADLIRVIVFAFVYPLHAVMTGLLKDQLIEKLENERILQSRMIASAKLSSLGEMAGGIAHEINNPVAIIQMRAEILTECAESGDLDSVTAIETGKVISSLCSRVAETIKGLRVFSREGTQDPFQLTTVQTVIEDTLRLCKKKFEAAGVALDVLMPSQSVQVSCRATQISQVLLHLLNNAFDAIADLRQRWIKIELIDQGDLIEIGVTDSGAGIAPEIQDKVMQPFFTTKPIGKGTGLGLSVSQGIVGSHQGKLFVDHGSPNTRFVVSIPKSQDLSGG